MLPIRLVLRLWPLLHVRLVVVRRTFQRLLRRAGRGITEYSHSISSCPSGLPAAHCAERFECALQRLAVQQGSGAAVLDCQRLQPAGRLQMSHLHADTAEHRVATELVVDAPCCSFASHVLGLARQWLWRGQGNPAVQCKRLT